MCLSQHNRICEQLDTFRAPIWPIRKRVLTRISPQSNIFAADDKKKMITSSRKTSIPYIINPHRKSYRSRRLEKKVQPQFSTKLIIGILNISLLPQIRDNMHPILSIYSPICNINEKNKECFQDNYYSTYQKLFVLSFAMLSYGGTYQYNSCLQ